MTLCYNPPSSPPPIDLAGPLCDHSPSPSPSPSPTATSSKPTGRQSGAKNKGPSNAKRLRVSQLPEISLSQEEEVRLAAYLSAIKGVRYGARKNTRGTLQDLLKLVARSPSSRSTLVRAVDSDNNLHPYLHNLAPMQTATEVYQSRLTEELEKLRSIKLFGEYTPDAFDAIGSQDGTSLMSQIKSLAPSLFGLLFNLCQNDKVKTPDSQNHSRIVSIISSLSFSRHPRLSNCLPAMLSLLLHSSGAKRHLFDITNSLGLTESYDSVLRTVEGLHSKAVEYLITRSRETIWAVAYDNCDLYIGVSEQSDGKKGENHSITSCIMFPYPGVLEDGSFRPLQQSDFRHDVEFGFPDLLPQEAHYQILAKARTAQIYAALTEAYPSIMPKKIERLARAKEGAEMPVVDLLGIPPSDIRKPIPLMPIQTDESTTANNIQILHNIFRDQLKLCDEHFELENPVHPVGGDNKTLNRMWSAKCGADGNTSKYNKLHHVFPLPGLFHAQMHIVDAITKLYWGAEAEKGKRTNQATLRYAAGKMARKFVSPTSQVYSHGRTFILDNYQARLLTEFQTHLFEHQELSASMGLDRHSTPDEVAEVISKLTPSELANLVDRTATSVRDFEACKDDPERTAHLSFVRDAELFVVFSHAIKHGDIGLLKATLSDLIILFSGASKGAYTTEFFYLKRILDTEFAAPDVQRALAAALFVNPSGRRDGFFAIDLANEFLNRDIKEVWANRRTSSTSVKKLSEYCTLNSIFFKPLKDKLHQLWGRRVIGNHARSNRGGVVRHLSKNLHRSMTHDTSRDGLVIPGFIDRMAVANKKIREV